MRFKKGFLLLVSLVFSGCQPADLGVFTPVEVCKAGIATVMGKPPRIISAGKSDGSIHNLFYYRQNDHTRWDFRCKLRSDRIIWATDTGPWRNRSGDPIVEFAIEDNRIAVAEIFSDGSHRGEIYNKKEL